MFVFGKLFNRKENNIDYDRLPAHIAIIPDGNGRWAKKRGLPRSIGHREGSNTLKKIVKYCAKIGIKYITVYAFSTENWKRSRNEVDALMSLLLEFLKNAEIELSGSNIRIKVIGDIKGLPEQFHKEIPRVEKMTANNTGLTLNLALNYGGRNELLNAVKNIVKEANCGKLKLNEISEDVISQNLFTTGIPDPDVLIRTSGEKRSSNFLLWQLAYTEFWYTDVLWPDINEKHINQAIIDYQSRHRRFGGV